MSCLSRGGLRNREILTSVCLYAGSPRESIHRMSRPRTLAAAAVLIVAIVAAYCGALRGDFLWDDDLHITANPTIIGPLGLKEIWTTARANYFPLVLTNFWAQHALWGLNPLGYHVVTLACHALAALLLWRVLVQLRVPGAWLGAALWALHRCRSSPSRGSANSRTRSRRCFFWRRFGFGCAGSK